MARRDAVRWPGAAWRAALAWCALPPAAWLPSVARRPGLAWLPSVARCPGWRDRPALHVGPAGVVAQRGALPRPGVTVQRCTSARLAWLPSVARCPGWYDRPGAARRPDWRDRPRRRAAPAGGRSRDGRRASRVYTQSRRDCYYCAPVAAEKNFFVPVGDKIGRKRPTFGTAAKTVL